MDENYLAWLAGFVDGEGSVCLSVVVRTGSSGRRNMNFFPVVSVHQHAQHREVLDEVVERFGFGKVYLRNKRKMAHYQPTNQEDAVRFLSALQPYLKVKNRQAGLLLEALAILKSRTRAGVKMTLGERSMNLPSAMRLVEIAASLNPKLSGSSKRYTEGKSLKSLERVAKAIYET